MSRKKSFAQKIITKLKRTLYREVTVILAAKYLYEDDHHINDIKYRPFTTADIQIFTSGFADLATLHKESAGRNVGLVAELDGKPACCIWYTSQTKENEGIPPFTFTITLPPGGVYIFANYVLPEFRGSKIFLIQPAMMLSLLHSIGYRVAVVALFDPRILKYYVKKGFFTIGNLHFKRFLSCIVKKDISDLERICTL